jgi:hypothetical protein
MPWINLIMCQNILTAESKSELLLTNKDKTTELSDVFVT